MLNTQPDMIQESLEHTLETMAFISSAPAEDLSPPDGPAVLIRLVYCGAGAGALELVCPAVFGTLVAANLLGCAPDDPAAAQRGSDALCELLNITCGTILRRSGATQRGLIEMNVPSQRPFDRDDWHTFVALGAAVVDADGHKLAVRLVELC